jgi:hypothetical protein
VITASEPSWIAPFTVLSARSVVLREHCAARACSVFPMNTQLDTQVNTRTDRPKRPGLPLRTVSAALAIAVASGMVTAVSAVAAPSARQEAAKTTAGQSSPRGEEGIDHFLLTIAVPLCLG